MPVEFTLYNEDGTVNLDLASKVMRWRYRETAKYDKTSGTNTFIYNPFTGSSRDTFYLQDDGSTPLRTITSTYGTKPANALRLRSGLVDGVIYVITPYDDIWMGSGATSKTAEYRDYYITEGWGSGQVDLSDLLQIFSETGELMWSMKTLNDAIVYNTTLRFTSVGAIQSFTSPRGRRLYLGIDNIFSSPSMNEYTTSNSGIIARWSNGGTTVEAAYFSYYDNDVINAMKRGSLPVDIYEVIGG